MKVMIATGGTGGHIYPATALAQIMLEKKPETEIVFFGSSNRMEAKVIPEMGYKFYGLEMTGTNGGLAAKMKSAVSLIKAEIRCRKILKDEKPDICMGFGNYISVPLIRAAQSAHIPTVLHEQNSFAGKANKFLANKCDAVVTCYECNKEQMPKANIRLLGNPQAALAAETEWDPAVLEKIGLNPDIPFAVFMMGSLGSSSVSKVIDEACPLFDHDFQVVIAAGKSNEYKFSYQSNDRIKIVDYVDGKKMLKGCALAVTRAGATTMAEIAATGAPSVLIPSPYVPNNHQYFNAMELVKQDAAAILEEKDLNAESLSAMVNSLMKDPERRKNMSERAKASGRTDAAEQIIKLLEELVHE